MHSKHSVHVTFSRKLSAVWLTKMLKSNVIHYDIILSAIRTIHCSETSACAVWLSTETNAPRVLSIFNRPTSEGANACDLKAGFWVNYLQYLVGGGLDLALRTTSIQHLNQSSSYKILTSHGSQNLAEQYLFLSHDPVDLYPAASNPLLRFI